MQDHLAAHYRLCGTAGIPSVAAAAQNIRLRRDEVLRLAKSAGVAGIEVRRGTIWLTGTPANGDILVRRGTRLELGAGAPFVLQALENTELSLLAEHAPRKGWGMPAGPVNPCARSETSRMRPVSPG